LKMQNLVVRITRTNWTSRLVSAPTATGSPKSVKHPGA
jgi:hypothetical protein